jgi:UDP-N-acetylmuramyl pentapeptide phosphotransferase/UDP-N-acetylglucosamine-1-phosphate transferase
MVSSLSLILVVNHHEVSPWFPIVLNFLPIFETLFSIYRRKIYKDINPSVADALHLHSLIYRRLVRKDKKNSAYSLSPNSKTSTIVWVFGLAQSFLAIIFSSNTPALLICFILLSWLYIYIYRSLVRFKLNQAI